MALPKPPFVSIQEAAIELKVSDERIRFFLEERHLAAYLPAPIEILINPYYEAVWGHFRELSEVARVKEPYLIGPDDKIHFDTLQILAKDTLEVVKEISVDGFPDINNILLSFPEIEKLGSSEKTPEEAPDAACNPSDRSFIRERDVWTITFEGKKGPIKDLTGLRYIAYLLERPREDVSCFNLYHAMYPSDTTTITKELATVEGLSIAARSKEIEAVNTPKTKKEFGERYRQLNEEHDQAESDGEKEKIENEQDQIEKALKCSRFRDPINSKAQSNVKKRINCAMNAIRQNNNFKSLVAHLEKNIKPDGKYGYFYTGASWEIILK